MIVENFKKNLFRFNLHSKTIQSCSERIQDRISFRLKIIIENSYSFQKHTII